MCSKSTACKVLFNEWMVMNGIQVYWMVTELEEERKVMWYSYPGVEAGENLFNSNCCRSDSVDSIHNLAGIWIVWIGRFHDQPISESHIGGLKTQPISDSFALMEKHVFKLCVTSYFCSGFWRLPLDIITAWYLRKQPVECGIEGSTYFSLRMFSNNL